MSQSEYDTSSPREYVGLPAEPLFLPGPSPRPVDLEQIRAMHDGRLSRALELEVRGLIIAYRDWAEADIHILLERIKDQCTEQADRSTTGKLPADSSTEVMVTLAGGHEALRHELGLYLARDYSELMDHLPLWMPTVVRSNPLGPYRALLERLLSPLFSRDLEPADVDPALEMQVAEAIVGSLAEAAASLPFPLPLVAAILIKEGWRAAM